jgi:hypothetical protein
MSQPNPEYVEKGTEFLYKVALVYANNYSTPSLYECTTKLKKARHIIIPDGASLGYIVLQKGLEYMLSHTELIAPQPVRYALILNDNITALKNVVKLPDNIDPQKNYAISIYLKGDDAYIELAELDDEVRNDIIDSVCYRPSPFG